jgi:hypothetical protein
MKVNYPANYFTPEDDKKESFETPFNVVNYAEKSFEISSLKRRLENEIKSSLTTNQYKNAVINYEREKYNFIINKIKEELSEVFNEN